MRFIPIHAKFRSSVSACLFATRRAVHAGVLFSVLGVIGFAQSDPAAGIIPFSTRATGVYYSLDMATSNIYVQIPIREKAGKIPFSYDLVTNSHAFPFGTQPKWLISNAFYAKQMGTAQIQNSVPSYMNYSSNTYTNQISTFSIVDTSGAQHPLTNVVINCPSSTTVTAPATDGSGYVAVIQGCLITDAVGPHMIYDRSGNSYPIASQQSTSIIIQDPDGATIKYGKGPTFVDSLNQSPLSVSWKNQTTLFQMQYNDAASNPQTFSLNYSAYTQQTVFGCAGVADIQPTSGVQLPSSLTTPTGTITFTYETTPGDTHTPHYTTGRLAGIAYPTGGSVSFAYSGGNHGVNCNSLVVPTLTTKLSDGNGNVYTWTYVNANASSTPGNFTVKVTGPAPANNQTVYYFAGEYQTAAQYYQGPATGTPLKTVVTCYNGNYSSQAACVAPGSLPALPIIQKDIYTSLGTSKPSLAEVLYDTYGNVIGINAYDFGATYPPTGQPLSSTTISYDYPPTSGGAYPCGTLNVPISDRPCNTSTVSLINGLYSTTNSIKYTYNSTLHPTQTSSWVSGSTFLNSLATYNSLGTPNVVTDADGTTYTHGYAGCSPLLPTSVAIVGKSVNLSGSMSWDCNGAVQTSLADENGNPVTNNFFEGSVADPYYRPLSIVDPLGSPLSYTYTPTTLERIMNFDGIISTVDVLVTTDGLGRQIFGQQRQRQGSSSFDSVQTIYGFNTIGMITTQSMPYTGTAGAPAPAGTPITTTQFDALGRPASVTDAGGGVTSYNYPQNDVLVTASPAPNGENTKARQYEYDGLGRMASVCEITSAQGSGTCGQSNPATGFLTRYTYDSLGNLLTVTQNAQPGAIGGQQTRTYYYDGLGRLTSETNPEWGPGTARYTYDSDSSGACPGPYTNGDLIKRIDNAGNVTCYVYDGLHRTLSTTYSGPNATGINRYFVYDAATVNGQSMTNAKGRIAEAYTATCATCTKVTDEGFGYNSRGDLSDFYESTPNSGGYYHVPMTYWANGLIETFGPFLTEPQYQVTPDGEGRMGAISELGYSVPSISYYTPSGQPTGNQPTQIMTSCAGSTCYPITYQYDPNTLRMTQYSAALSTGTISGTLMWNPNGSLQQLAIADPYNSADVQTCTYGADDLSRIASANCVNGSTSVWSQNFSYDAFGNITKSGSISWMPGYNSSTNQYTLGGTSYDADGNVLKDSFNVYTWDAEGKPLSTAYSNGQTYTFVYDAFGHQVEWSSNGTYQASRVTLGNFKLSAQGQTAYYSEYPFPGGSFESENGGATGVQLADWLGTSRAFYSYTGGNWGQSGAHAPFGEAYSYSSGYPKDFTGQQNDGSMNNTTYYFPERQYRSSQGRWLSPDPAGLAAADPYDPQSWNRYSYVENSPNKAVDPLGLRCTIYVFGVNDKKGTFDPFPPSDASAYPFSGMGLVGGVLSAAGGAVGTNSAELATLLEEYQTESGGIDLVGYSGGAQVASNLIAGNPGLAQNIASTTWISPGLSPFFGAWLYQADDSQSFKGSGVVDFMATLGARLEGVPLTATGAKGHNFDKEFESGPVQARLNNFAGSRGSCQGGAYGGGGVFDPGSAWEIGEVGVWNGESWYFYDYFYYDPGDRVLRPEVPLNRNQ